MTQSERDALLEKIETSMEIIGPVLCDYAGQTKHQPPETKRGYAGQVILRNTTIAAGGAIVVGVLGNRADALVLWLYENHSVIMTVAKAYGASFMSWFAPIMEAFRHSGGQSYQAFKQAYNRLTLKQD